jgi:hypothetical protein
MSSVALLACDEYTLASLSTSPTKPKNKNDCSRNRNIFYSHCKHENKTHTSTKRKPSQTKFTGRIEIDDTIIDKFALYVIIPN